ncbi:WD repeat protein 35, related [Eimeria mitis]|uniref:WD repeat protein 35, related n=1 Tax=Eimeria mitis TaxID=44415 RepID=U6KGL9_9EIME|nr:WD repeat protein 35, related [Eimeria mitis]CDJ35916.1 WD repeat protein 35, related [Eimeria mitis]
MQLGLSGSTNAGSIVSEDIEAWHTQCRSGHTGPVFCVSADTVCGLLATGDSDGSIRIWEEAEGKWNQLSSFCLGVPGVLVGLQWVPCGGCSPQMSLCLLHDNGHLVCVTVEGQRLWSRDVKKCSCFCASPNGTGFVLASNDGEVSLHDSRGIYIRKLGSKVEAAGQGVAALAWQPGSWAFRPILAAYANGKGVLLQTDGDAQPLSFETGLASCVAASWNPSGMLAAFLGLPGLAASSVARHSAGKLEGSAAEERRQTPDAWTLLVLVQACGKIVVTINLASAEPRELAWAAGGERLAAAAENGIFIFSLRRPAACCSYGENTVAATGLFPRKQLTTEVSFLRGPGDYRTVRRFRGPRFLVSRGSLCAVVPQATPALPPTFLWQSDRFGALLQPQHQEGPHRLPDDNGFRESPTALRRPARETGQEGFPVELCDTSGNTVETILSPVGPTHAILLPHWLVIAGSSHDLWLYHLTRKENNRAVPLSALVDLNVVCEFSSRDTINGSICALDGRGESLIVARTTGQLLRLRTTLTTPHIQLEASAVTPSHSSCFAANLCDPVEAVLDYMWASDHDDLIAVLQHMGILLLHTRSQGGAPSLFLGVEAPKEPLVGPLYLVEFYNLRARALCFSTLLQQKIAEPKQEAVRVFEAEPLLQMRHLLGASQKRPGDSGGLASLQKAAAFAARFNHPILWRLLAEAALALEDLGITEEALVRCEDYCSLQVLKQARLLNPRAEGRPFIAALSGDILGAGAFYEAQQKPEHAAHLFSSFGMWDAASDTLKLAVSAHSRGEQSSLRKVRMALAEAWKEQGNWIPAIDLYSSLKPQEGLLEVYFLSGRYEELESLVCKLSDVDPELLLRAAQLLAAAGRGAASADAFLKAGRAELAVDAALYGGEWVKAVSLARQHCNSTKLQVVTSVYRNAMQHQQKKCSSADVVEAFLTIGAFEAAAHELARLPRQLGHLLRNPRKQRKMHITAALLARKHHLRAGHKTMESLDTPCLSTACNATSENSALKGRVALSISANSTSAEEEHHWHSAAACHLYLLCCFHLSEKRARAALCTAVRLWESYQRELSLYLSAQLLFISAYKSQEWDLCSQALHAMQMDAQVPPGGKQRLDATNLLVFSRRQGLEAPRAPQLPCPNCNALSSYWECFCPSCDFSFPWCAATGLPVRYISCIMQRKSAIEIGGHREGRHSEMPVQSLTPEDRGWSSILSVNPEDILCQADCLSELVSA